MDTLLILDFLSELKENNNREWFQVNRKRFDAATAEFKKYVATLIAEVLRFDSSIGGLTPRDCLFRIYRDVRFSADKSPYKINFGAFLAPGGRKSLKAGYYFHLEPGNSLLGGGIYMPMPDVQKKLRQEVYFHVEEFKGILNHLDFLRYFGAMDTFDKMKKPPRDFPADFPDIDLLKYRSYTILHTLPEAMLFSDALVDYTIAVFKAMKPLNDFLSRAVEG
jgi:uncharacterized protein (TIGR02453 family)